MSTSETTTSRPRPSTAPIGTTPYPEGTPFAVPKKSDLVSPQYEKTRVRTTERSTASSTPRGTRTGSQTKRILVQKKQVVVKKGDAEKIETKKTPPLKGGYILFFLVLGLAVAKDALDAAILLLDLLGLGISATGIGAPIGVPLAVFSEIISKLASLFFNFTMLAYFWFIGGKLALRLVIMSVGAIIDIIPIVNILPMTTLTFVLAFLAGRMINKVTSTTLGSLATSSLVKKI